ncbi:MAG: hypothetical protein ACD_2C00122G0005 [uncultured bacterium (gcode 4)]|uniref:Uncharacterized protein n=1 Tax=uncultured bacterium (gcode 4) TaxID=1234023 RepID=K2G3B3_9BACT|nr:MAG: hypothetical protein ACD_2C00122G0005 [uncultured bacterium (gcode 4)]
MKKSIIHIHWTSCSGKSTLFEEVRKNNPGIFTVSSDYLKWQLDGYNSAAHKDLIEEFVFSALETACKNGLMIILDSYMRTGEIYERFMDISNRYWYVFHDYLITAPRDILIGRFRDRIESVKVSGRTTSVMDEMIFIKNMEKKFYVPEGIKVFDTSAMNIQEIYAHIEADILLF